MDFFPVVDPDYSYSLSPGAHSNGSINPTGNFSEGQGWSNPSTGTYNNDGSINTDKTGTDAKGAAPIRNGGEHDIGAGILPYCFNLRTYERTGFGLPTVRWNGWYVNLDEEKEAGGQTLWTWTDTTLANVIRAVEKDEDNVFTEGHKDKIVNKLKERQRLG